MTKLSNVIQKERGFTIVELLVVIVVIGILAAITIVSYTGISAKANLASAQTAANNVYNKAMVYSSDPAGTGLYPATLSVLTGAAATATYFMNSAVYEAMGTVTTNVTVPAATPTAPVAKSGILYAVCGVQAVGTNTAPTNLATIVTITGFKAYYWDYTTNLITTSPYTAGTITGTVGTQNVACAAAGA